MKNLFMGCSSLNKDKIISNDKNILKEFKYK